MGFLELLFPKTCLGCGKKGQYLCSNCISKIKIINQICPVCQKPSFFGQIHHFCQKKWSLDGLISIFPYKGIIRETILQLKFKYVTELEEELFNLTSDLFEKSDSFSQIKQFLSNGKPIVIPVPLHWYKENYRGFNQSEIFGKRLAEKFDLEIKKNILIRCRFTQPQFGLDKKERKENIKGAFMINPRIRDLSFNVLLIDDIWTTGITLKTCASLLKKSGAKIVWGLTIAR